MGPLHRALVSNVRRIAREKRIPISHLADRAGVSRTHAWRILRGGASPTIAWLERVASVLGVSVIDLLRSEPPPSDDTHRRD